MPLMTSPRTGRRREGLGCNPNRLIALLWVICQRPPTRRKIRTQERCARREERIRPVQVRTRVFVCWAPPVLMCLPFIDVSGALAPATNTLRRTSRIEFPKASGTEICVKKKKDASSPVLGHTRRKPTLIRHLGSASGPKGTNRVSSGS